MGEICDQAGRGCGGGSITASQGHKRTEAAERPIAAIRPSRTAAPPGAACIAHLDVRKIVSAGLRWTARRQCGQQAAGNPAPHGLKPLRYRWSR